MRGPFLTRRYASPGPSTPGGGWSQPPSLMRGWEAAPGASQCQWVALVGRGSVLGSGVVPCSPGKDGSGRVAVQGCTRGAPQLRAPWPCSCRLWENKDREVLVQWSPGSSLGPFLAKELSSGYWGSLRRCGSFAPILCGSCGLGSLCLCGVEDWSIWHCWGSQAPALLWPKCCLEPCQGQEPCCRPPVCPSCSPPARAATQLLPGPSWGCCHWRSQDLLALSQGSFLFLTPSLTALSCRREKR